MRSEARAQQLVLNSVTNPARVRKEMEILG